MDVPELVLPPLEAGGHLVDYLYRVGPATGGEALTFQEIVSWQEATGRQLDAWEAETLRILSGAYLSEQHEAKDPNRPPPFFAAGRDAPSRQDVDAKLDALFSRLEGRSGKSGLAGPPR